MVQAFGNILTKRLKNILDNYPNSRPLILMRYMKKHLKQENVFNLIEDTCTKLATSNLDN